VRDLSLEVLCDGIIRTRDNAQALLEEAMLMREHNRMSRAFALAYMSCEECGKISVLFGAASRTARGLAVDWRRMAKRFRSHDSKASQFFGIALAARMVLKAVEDGQKVVDAKELRLRGAMGVTMGPSMFSKRNASMYCDFRKGSFTSPSEQIAPSDVDNLIELAKVNIEVADTTMGRSVEEALKKIAAHASREHPDYDALGQKALGELASELEALAPTTKPQKAE
jgi:AbiV family abortive infection protein